jgi:signal transduction histidine kinase
MESIASVSSSAPATPNSERSDFSCAVEVAKLQALYNFAYGLSHEINNPLANISARAQMLLVDEMDPERRRKLATILQQAFKAHEMIADLMLFARPPTMRPQVVDVAKLSDTVVAEMQEQAQDQQTRLIRSGDTGPLIAQVDSIQIAVALKALIQNSLEALKHGGEVEVLSAQYSVRSNGTGEPPKPESDAVPHSAIRPPHFLPIPQSAIPNRQLVLAVADTGPGIPPETLPHIFDPFFSGREAGRGLGLGLSKAWRIVELHGGRIEVESEPGNGARFIIALPVNSDD